MNRTQQLSRKQKLAHLGVNPSGVNTTAKSVGEPSGQTSG